jgi:acyl-CoA oxidase
MESARRLSTLKAHVVSEFNFPDDPSLDEYRQRGAVFDKQVFYKTYYALMPELLQEFSQQLAKDPLMQHGLDYEQPRNKLRELGLLRIVNMKKYFDLTPDEEWRNPNKGFILSCGIISFDTGLATLLGVHGSLYIDTLRSLGSAKHDKLVHRAYSLKDLGCFAMTELGHGSNVAAIDTTATYDNASRTFVLNSPRPLAAKFWIGAAGKSANMTVVFAQLYMGNKCKGVHAFAVPIRDRKTHTAMSGVVVGDCGAKVGLDCIDNGFMLFRQYRVPYDSLLDRLSSITPEGKFKSNIKNPDKRFATMLSGLIRGRLSCLVNSESNSRNALTVAVRYAAIRKQFSYGDAPERPILDYTLHRYRLIPHLANTFACNAAGIKVERTFAELRQKIHDNPECAEAEELHASLSAFKVLTTGYARDSIQECREACGGLGFSAYSGLGRLRENQDVILTWEGDNHVLIQQAARYILKIYQRIFKGMQIQAKSLSYLVVDPTLVTEARASFASKSDIKRSPSALQNAFEFRVNLLLQKSVVKLQENLGNASHVVEAWNMTQPFYLQELAKAYGETTLYAEMVSRAESAACPVTRDLLMRLAEVYALSKVYKHLGFFRETYMTAEQGQLVQDYLLEVCVELGESAVKIIDAIASPDELIGSALGRGDGQAYRNLLSVIESAPGCYSKADWISILQDHRATLKTAK